MLLKTSLILLYTIFLSVVVALSEDTGALQDCNNKFAMLHVGMTRAEVEKIAVCQPRSRFKDCRSGEYIISCGESSLSVSFDFRFAEKRGGGLERNFEETKNDSFSIRIKRDPYFLPQSNPNDKVILFHHNDEPTERPKGVRVSPSGLMRYDLVDP